MQSVVEPVDLGRRRSEIPQNVAKDDKLDKQEVIEKLKSEYVEVKSKME